jgi:predicted hotdog family 3-hydroxylacyl-ACP dehydratase
MADYTPDIATLIPQGPPFVMVDRFLGSDGPVTKTGFRVAADNPLVGNGRLTVAGLIENIAQTAAAGAGYTALVSGGAVRGGAIVSVSNLVIDRLPDIGEELLTEINVTARVADIVVISGRITCRDTVIATGEMKILIGV